MVAVVLVNLAVILPLRQDTEVVQVEVLVVLLLKAKSFQVCFFTVTKYFSFVNLNVVYP